jgi:HAD superfamily hydrolase (TIGR01509 family)
MALADHTHWIFDMDGTLTVPVHDFDRLHAALGVPRGVDLLTVLAARTPEQRAADLQIIAAWEDEAAALARPQEDAVALLEALVGAGRTLGILTRNTRGTSARTLAAAGLERYFVPDNIVTRDCAAPKPDPAGVALLLRRWGVAASQAVVVGDWVYDAQAGRRAGAATVLVMRHGPKPWDDEADWLVPSLWEVTATLRGATG